MNPFPSTIWHRIEQCIYKLMNARHIICFFSIYMITKTPQVAQSIVILTALSLGVSSINALKGMKASTKEKCDDDKP